MMRDSTSAPTEADKNLNTGETPKAFKTLPTHEATATLKELLGRFGSITDGWCVQAGDAIRSLRAQLTPRQYHAALRQLRLTPVAAWDYAQISKNALLRNALRSSGRPARPDHLSIIANLSDVRLRSILNGGIMETSQKDQFACQIVSGMREAQIMEAGSRFGWPYVDLRPGETWIITLIPTKMGVQASCFIRVGFHEDGRICPRTTDAKLGGHTAAHCPMCDQSDERSGFGADDKEFCPTAHWAMFCIVSEITKGREARVYWRDLSEPFLLVATEQSFRSIIRASLKGTDGQYGFSPIDLRLDDNEDLTFHSWGAPEFQALTSHWAQKLQEPGQLRVTARDWNV